jgi:3-hydroxyisobutyrate dehydrogenase
MSLRVAFIGLGIMGLPMAGHVLARGHRLTVHTRTKSKAEELLSRGAAWADSSAEAARDAEIVCVCVTDTPDVEKVLMGRDGVIEGAKLGTIVIDHSTISPIATRHLAAELAQRDLALLDAPVSGGDVGAKNGTLAIMVGGDESALTRAKPVLESYGKTITHCGESGAGQFTKLVNQILVSINLTAVCEALSFAKDAGIDMNTAIAATSAGAAGSWQLANLGPKIAAGDYKPGFMIDLLLKDLRILAESTAATKTNLPVASLVTQLFAKAQASNLGKQGTPAVFEVIKSKAE